MARIDAGINEPTPTGVVADRADVWRVALALLRGAGLVAETRPDDVLELTRWLAGDDF